MIRVHLRMLHMLFTLQTIIQLYINLVFLNTFLLCVTA